MNSTCENHSYVRWLDTLGDGRIREVDLEECGGDEDEAARFGLSALPRERQAAIFAALDASLEPVKHIEKHSPSSYAIKHAAEDFTGEYVSKLQARTCMRILGYRRTVRDVYPRYNVSAKAWKRFREAADEASRERAGARPIPGNVGAWKTCYIV